MRFVSAFGVIAALASVHCGGGAKQCSSTISNLKVSEGTTAWKTSPTDCSSENAGSMGVAIGHETLSGVQIDAVGKGALDSFAPGDYTCAPDSLHVTGNDSGAPDPNVWNNRDFVGDSGVGGSCSMHVGTAKTTGRLKGNFSGHLCRQKVDFSATQCIDVSFDFDFDTAYAKQ